MHDDSGAYLSVNADLVSGDMSGYLDLDEFPLERIIEIFRREEFGHTGRLTGRAEIGGTIKDPFFTVPGQIALTLML